MHIKIYLKLQDIFEKYNFTIHIFLIILILKYLRFYQSTIRTDLYNGVQNTLLQKDNNADAVGWCIILPSSYTGED